MTTVGIHFHLDLTDSFTFAPTIVYPSLLISVNKHVNQYHCHFNLMVRRVHVVHGYNTCNQEVWYDSLPLTSSIIRNLDQSVQKL